MTPSVPAFYVFPRGGSSCDMLPEHACLGGEHVPFAFRSLPKSLHCVTYLDSLLHFLTRVLFPCFYPVRFVSPMSLFDVRVC